MAFLPKNMAQMKNKFGDIIEIPEAEMSRATASGYTAVAGMPKASEAGIVSPTSPGAGYIKGYDTNAQGQQVWVKEGQYYPGVSATPYTPKGAVGMEDLEKAQSTVIPPLPKDEGTQANALVAGADANMASIMKSFEVAETPEEMKQQSLLDQMASLTGEMGQKAADQLTAEQSAKIPELKDQFANLNSQILTKMAEYKVLQTENQNRPITMNSIIGNERAIMNAKAADVGLLQAQAQGLQGQIETAQNTANRAVDLKYSTKEAQLNTLQAQLNALLPTLNKQEKAQAEARQILLDNQKQAMADDKEKEKQIQSLMIKATEAGITDINILNKIGSAGDIVEATRILVQNAPPTADENVLNIMTKYPDAGISPTDNLVTAQAKIKNSRIYQDQVRAPSSGGGGGSSKITTDELVTTIAGSLKSNSAFGEDGKISWESYLWAYQNWLNNGGTKATFDANFPVRQYLDEGNLSELNRVLGA